MFDFVVFYYKTYIFMVQKSGRIGAPDMWRSTGNSKQINALPVPLLRQVDLDRRLSDDGKRHRQLDVALLASIASAREEFEEGR